jgi:hypothetical protein
MSHDDLQQPTGADVDDADAPDANEELSDEALADASGGYMPVRNYTSPFGDQG